MWTHFPFGNDPNSVNTEYWSIDMYVAKKKAYDLNQKKCYYQRYELYLDKRKSYIAFVLASMKKMKEQKSSGF